jgi:hypothetical protein
VFGIIRHAKGPNSKRLLNKYIKFKDRSNATMKFDKGTPKAEYLDRLLKRKSIREK